MKAVSNRVGFEGSESLSRCASVLVHLTIESLGEVGHRSVPSSEHSNRSRTKVQEARAHP